MGVESATRLDACLTAVQIIGGWRVRDLFPVRVSQNTQFCGDESKEEKNREVHDPGDNS